MSSCALKVMRELEERQNEVKMNGFLGAIEANGCYNWHYSKTNVLA